MRSELERVQWTALDSPYADAAVLPGAILDLCTTSDRETAELAAARILRVLPLQEALSPASVAAASALVHGLWGCDEEVIDLVLGVLADMAAGYEEDEPNGGDYTPLHRQCLSEIREGFFAFVEILESSSNLDARTACIDLITACGLADPRLTERAAFYLRSAAVLPGLQECTAVISDSIEELRARL